MTSALVVIFLFAHGLVHPAIWAAPRPPEPGRTPFDPAHSWVLAGLGVAARRTRTVSATLAIVAGGGFVTAALGALADANWWASAAVFAAVTGLSLKVLCFNPWLLVGMAIDAAVIVAVVAEWPATLY